MLTGLEVLSPDGISARELPISGSPIDFDPILIKGIEGLNPVKANITTAGYADLDGESLSGLSVGKRNIVMTFGLNPDWDTQTVAELRKLLYEYFMTKASVILRFTSDHLPVVQIQGWVESFETVIFAKDPEVQVSIVCPQPNFVASEATFLSGVVGPAFDVLAIVPVEVNYEGSIATGAIIRVETSTDVPTYTGPIRVQNQTSILSIMNTDPVTVDSTRYFEINTQKFQKGVRNVLIPSGGYVNLLGYMGTYGTPWLELKPGLNLVGVGSTDPGQVWSITYFGKFGGL